MVQLHVASNSLDILAEEADDMAQLLSGSSDEAQADLLDESEHRRREVGVPSVLLPVPITKAWRAWIGLAALALAACAVCLRGRAAALASPSISRSRFGAEQLAEVQQLPVKVVQTAQQSGDKLAWKADLYLSNDFSYGGTTIEIDSLNEDQELFGFGGAFTESSAVIFQKLSADLQESFLEQYFGETGLRYTLGRVHINSCDFSVDSYTFDDQQDDFNLESFDYSLMHDTKALIPLIRRAKRKVDNVGAGHIASAGLRCNSNDITEREKFRMVQQSDGSVSFRAFTGKYVTVEEDGQVHVDRDVAAGWESFNITHKTATAIGIRSFFGSYLSATKDGFVSSRSDHIGIWESFMLVNNQDGTVSLQCVTGKYLSADSKQALRLLATPWSPPAWMKTNKKMDGSGTPCLRKDCQNTWAQYIAKWISAYKAQDIPIWALSVQNEPTNNAPWEACLLAPEEEADFLGHHLGPILRDRHPELSIFVFDDSKHALPDYVASAMRHPRAKQYTDGAAFHWYSGDHFDKVEWVHKSHPHVMLLASEATYEKRMWQAGKVQAYSDWRFGEGYAHDIIGDLNAGAIGWIDWNLLLDKSGGPNHVGNVCDAAIVADCQAQQLEIHPQYYFIGHFSKFIPPGSRRLKTRVLSTAKYNASQPAGPYGTCTGENGLETTTFRTLDNTIVTVVLNCADAWIDFKLRNGATAFKTSIPPHAIQTYLLPGR